MQPTKKYYIDPLTGAYSRAFFEEQLPGIFANAVRENRKIQLIILDIDYFKRINDFYGHRIGDSVLKEFASFLRDNIRKDDILIRYGGDEFLAFLFDIDYDTALSVSKRILEKVKYQEFAKQKISISAGVAGFPEHAKILEDLFKLADQSLYNAKRSGKAQVGVPGRARVLKIPSPNMVGSELELSTSLDFLMSYNKGILLITGETGIGKTRLLQEILKTNDLKSLEKYEVILTPLTTSIMLFPFREILREGLHRNPEIVDKLTPPSRKELAKLYPHSKTFEDDQIYVVDKYALFESFSEYIQALAQNKILFVIENLQWADRYSVELLQYLLMNININNFIVIATIRSEDIIFKPHFKTLKLLRSEVNFCEVKVKHLNQMEIEELLFNFFDHELDRSLVELVYHKTAGNPFFIGEIIQHFIRHGKIYWNGNKWVFDSSIKVEVPATIAMAVEMKIANMNKLMREVVEYMAVFGMPINLETLELILSRPNNEITEIILLLIECTILKRDETGKYWFHENIIAEVIYEIMDPEKRKRIHHQIAKILKEYYPDRVEEIAYHMYLSEEYEEALSYCIKAAEMAQNFYNFDSAISLYTNAINILEKKHEKDHSIPLMELKFKRGILFKQSGESDQAIKDFQEVLKTAENLGNLHYQFDALLNLASIFMNKADFKRALNHLTRANEIAKSFKDPKMEAEVLIKLGNYLDSRSKISRAFKFYSKALNLAKRAGNKDLMVKTTSNLAYIYLSLGKYEKALEYYHQALNLCKEQKNTIYEAQISLNLGIVYANQLLREKAEEYFLKAIEVAEKTKNVPLKAIATHNLGLFYLHVMGDPDQAEKVLEQSLQTFYLIGHKNTEISNLNSLSIIARRKGEFSKALNLLRKAWKLASEIKDYSQQYFIAYNQALSLWETGKYSEAQKKLNKAEELLKKLKTEWRTLEIEELKGAIYYHQGLVDEAEKLLKSALSKIDDTYEATRRLSILLSLAGYYVDSLKISEAEKVLQAISWQENSNLPLTYFAEKKLLEAEINALKGGKIQGEELRELLEKAKQQSLLTLYYRGFLTFAIIEVCTSDFERALQDLTLAAFSFKNLNMPFFEAKAYVLEHVVLSKMKKYKEAKKAFEKASKILRRIKSDLWIEEYKVFSKKLKKLISQNSRSSGKGLR
jgi:diguanylate cyclase (GGDEF)-like protein